MDRRSRNCWLDYRLDRFCVDWVGGCTGHQTKCVGGVGALAASRDRVSVRDRIGSDVGGFTRGNEAKPKIDFRIADFALRSNSLNTQLEFLCSGTR